VNEGVTVNIISGKIGMPNGALLQVNDLQTRAKNNFLDQ